MTPNTRLKITPAKEHISSKIDTDKADIDFQNSEYILKLHELSDELSDVLSELQGWVSKLELKIDDKSKYYYELLPSLLSEISKTHKKAIYFSSFFRQNSQESSVALARELSAAKSTRKIVRAVHEFLYRSKLWALCSLFLAKFQSLLSGDRSAKEDRISDLEVKLVEEAIPYAESKVQNTNLNAFGEWSSVFHYCGERYGSMTPSVSDRVPGITEFDRWNSIAGKKILEIGPFEGANTKQLIDLQASKVTSIEANREFFLKCLTVKEEFKLQKAEFVYGDCNEIMETPKFRGKNQFDVCVASGVLYHMADPLRFLDLVTSYAPVLYLWTQVATNYFPKSEWQLINSTRSSPASIRAKVNVYQTKEHFGGICKHAMWLHPDDLVIYLSSRGMAVEHLDTGSNVSGQFVEIFARNVNSAR